MSKKRPKEELQSILIDPKNVQQITEVAESVFKTEFEKGVRDFREKLTKQEGLLNKIIWGGIIATSLVVLTLWLDSHYFRANYQQGFLDTQATINQQINDLRKENAELKTELLREVDKTQEKQDYLERLLLQQTNKSS